MSASATQGGHNQAVTAALIQHLRENCNFCVSLLPGSAEAQVICGGIVKCPLIDYFIGNVSAKKYQNSFTCVNIIASQRWDVLKF